MTPIQWITGGWHTSKYAVTENGKLGIDVDKLYGFQCYDFTAAYTDFLGDGVTRVTGAVDFWTLAPASYEQVQDPLPGDIHIYGAPYGWDGKRYLGHTGLVTGGTRNSFTSIDQNWINASLSIGSPPTPVTHNNIGLVGFLRKKGVSMTPQDMAAMKFVALRQNSITQPEIDKYQNHLPEFIQYLQQVQVEHNISPQPIPAPLNVETVQINGKTYVPEA